VQSAKNYNVIGTKWFFRNKQNEDGIVVRNKVRLVAQGFVDVLSPGPPRDTPEVVSL
jgi:hypothetical protein